MLASQLFFPLFFPTRPHVPSDCALSRVARIPVPSSLSYRELTRGLRSVQQRRSLFPA